MNLEKQADAAGLPRDISPALFKKFLVYLFIVGLIIRAGFMVEHARSPSFAVVTLDQKFYDSAARLMLSGDDLHLLRGIRPLLYPMFLAGCYKVSDLHGIDLAIALQHLMGILTAVLVAVLGHALFRHRLCGLIGGFLYVLAPVPLYFEGELLVESTYTVLICLTLWLLILGCGARGGKAAAFWIGAGALTILAAQERPNLFILLAVFPLLAIWQSRRKRPALLPLLGLVGGMLMAVPWGYVNQMQSDRFQPMPSEGGVNLYLGNRRGADGMVVQLNRRVTYSEKYEDSVEIWARQGYQAAMRAQGVPPKDDPMAVSHYWTQRALEEIKASPVSWLHLMAKKTWLLFWNAEIPNNKAFAFLQTEYLWLKWLPVRWVVLLMFVPAGIWAAAKWGNHGALFVLCAYILLYSGTNVLFFICDRYRYPIWPATAAIAGGGVLAIFEAFRWRSRNRSVILTASVLMMAALSLINWFGAELPNFARDYLFRSVAWYEKGHFPEALRDIDRSVQLDPDDVTALHQRGNTLIALGRYGEASQALEATLAIDATDAGVWNNYGVALDNIGKTNQAMKAYRQAMDCQPPSRRAFFDLAFDQVRLGKLEDATATLDQMNNLYRKPDAVALAIRSVIYAKKGNAAGTQEALRQARALNPSDADWALDHLQAK